MAFAIFSSLCSEAIEKAFEHFQKAPSSERKIFLFGGLKGDNKNSKEAYQSIAKSIQRCGIDHIFVYGDHPFHFLRDEIKNINPFQFETEQAAFDELKKIIQPNDLILIKGDKKIPIDAIIETFNESLSSNQCIINLAAIAENITQIRHKLPKNTRVMVMVKALAYGTDEVRIAKFLQTQDIDILGVSYADEGVALRRAKITQSIFVISAAVYEAFKIVKYDLEVGVSDSELIQALSNAAIQQNKKVKVHLHVNTGMGRFGCRKEEALPLAKEIMSNKNLILEGVMTHFASSDDPLQDNFTISQANDLEHVVKELNKENIYPKYTHAANSSGAIRFHFPFFNMVRIGLAIYGLSPSQATKKALDLRLAISLVSRIVGINKCKKDETISYGRSYKVEKEDQTIAVLPVGYFDGLHRNYSGKSSVIIHGKKALMVGKICMDFMMVDVTDIPEAKAGDEVLIFGENEFDNYLSPEELAISGNSITHELITCLGPRIQRIFIHEEAHIRH